MKKCRILSLILALMLLPGLSSAMAETQTETYICGDFEYVLLDNGTAEITDYTGEATNLEIPAVLDGKAVTAIGESAFYGCDTLKSVAIPDSVTEIGDWAFANCYLLNDTILPNSIQTIGMYAFMDCFSLRDFVIPDSVMTIGECAFQSCIWLQSITVPDSVTQIGDDAFGYCTSLVLTVTRDSYAEQYANENGLEYTYPDAEEQAIN